MYKHLNETEREELFILREKGYSFRSIGKSMGRDHTTLARECERNLVKNGYLPKKAQQKAYQRRYWCKKESKKILKYPALREYVEHHSRSLVGGILNTVRP